MQSNLKGNAKKAKELVDALRDTICTHPEGQKSLAVDLDYSFSNWSQICGKPERFPLLKTPTLMRITDNIEILETLADMFGFRLVRKEILAEEFLKMFSDWLLKEKKIDMEPEVIAEAIKEFSIFNIRTYDHMRKRDD